jgi:hypothetical protein
VVIAIIDEAKLRTREEASQWKPRFEPAMQPGDWVDFTVDDGEHEAKAAAYVDVEVETDDEEWGGEGGEDDECVDLGDEADEEDVVEMSVEEADARDARDAAFVVADEEAEKSDCEPEQWETASEIEEGREMRRQLAEVRAWVKELDEMEKCEKGDCVGHEYVFDDEDGEE